MAITTLRDANEANRFLVQSFWFQRVVEPRAAVIYPVLDLALEIGDKGSPLPPLGFLADLWHLIFGTESTPRRNEFPALEGVPPTLSRSYEDHVLGKLFIDLRFERAADAVKRYSNENRERLIGMAFIVKQFRERAGIGGVEVTLGSIRALRALEPEEVLRQGWDSIQEFGVDPIIIDLYRELIQRVRVLPESLATEDLLALEQRTALSSLGQYVAHRQIIQATQLISRGLPNQKVKPLLSRPEVPTRVVDEDYYPVGGYSSIANRGSVESLLQSQLAYIDPDPANRPDLFEIKYVRDELFFYSRDENQFLRRRRSFIFVFEPNLTSTRTKDRELPFQRIVFLLASTLSVMQKLSDWLSTDALRFEFWMIGEGGKCDLQDEFDLLKLMLRELIENDTANLEIISSKELSRRADEQGKRSQCQLVRFTTKPMTFPFDFGVASQFMIEGSRPAIKLDDRNQEMTWNEEDSLQAWIQATSYLIAGWI
jgi:hypothetical protein